MMISAVVTVRVVYEVACDICGVMRLDGDTFDTRDEAEEARSMHIQEHRQAEDPS